VAKYEETAAAVAVAPVVPLVLNPTPNRTSRPPSAPNVGETDNLAALLLHKVAGEAPEAACGVTPSPDTAEVRAAYVRYRFASRLKALQRGNRTYGRLDTALNLTTIAAGIGTSLVAASNSEPLWTVSLGVAIAACQTLSQWLKPSQRAAQRGRAALEMRTEAWNILQGHDHYRGKDVDRAWDYFCRQVDRIDGQAQTQADADACEAPNVTVKGGGVAPVPSSHS
jgi:hypothetical protein